MTPIREAFVRLISFSGLSFDLALRKFLVDSNFRVSGEAQVISRMMESFGQCFFEEDEQKTFANPGSPALDCPFYIWFSRFFLTPLFIKMRPMCWRTRCSCSTRTRTIRTCATA